MILSNKAVANILVTALLESINTLSHNAQIIKLIQYKFTQPKVMDVVGYTAGLGFSVANDLYEIQIASYPTNECEYIW